MQCVDKWMLPETRDFSRCRRFASIDSIHDGRLRFACALKEPFGQLWNYEM